MVEMCRGAHKSLYKGSVADANSLKQQRNKIKWETKKQRRKISTGRSDSDFWLLFVLLHERWFCALSLFFDARFWDFFFPCHRSWQLFPLVEDFLMSQLDEGSWVLGGMERREKHRRRERLYLKACVCGLQSVSTSTLGCHHSAQHRASRLYPGRLGPDTSWCVIQIAHQLFELLNPQQDSVCCNYSITSRLWWLACFA